MPDPFGSWAWICSHTPMPQCNLFFTQLFHDDTPQLTALFPSSSDFFAQYNVTGSSSTEDPVVLAAKGDAGTGIAANCEIARAGHRGSSGDIALMVISALSLLFTLFLILRASRRRAAVGRSEIRLLLIAYLVHCGLQIVTMSSVLEQGTKGLAAVSAVHTAVVVVVFWLLLGDGLIATQVVEDGTAAALAPLSILTVLFFVPTLYISLDTSLHWTETFHMSASDVESLRATALFVLTLLWPAFAALLYLLIMLYIVIKVLNEIKPAFLYLGSFVLFAASQVVFFLASQPLCDASNGKINSSFIAALLETAAVGILYLAWLSITEDDWGDEQYGMGMY
ncbi:hypothetical protein IAT38_008017 [Cryptococcus sp. DSM 104549]